ncbi:MAG: hypothetical protein IT386_13470 [Deltaproteobacteria bacterium]|nr:hypothetical protein [Deltaproteobacteria bacterium]
MPADGDGAEATFAAPRFAATFAAGAFAAGAVAFGVGRVAAFAAAGRAAAVVSLWPERLAPFVVPPALFAAAGFVAFRIFVAIFASSFSRVSCAA